MKKKLSEQQEFDIMKLVLDKFLWIGTIIMVYGVYVMISTEIITEGLPYLIVGAMVLIAFLVFIVREFEVMK